MIIKAMTGPDGALCGRWHQLDLRRVVVGQREPATMGRRGTSKGWKSSSKEVNSADAAPIRRAPSIVCTRWWRRTKAHSGGNAASSISNDHRSSPALGMGMIGTRGQGRSPAGPQSADGFAVVSGLVAVEVAERAGIPFHVGDAPLLA